MATVTTNFNFPIPQSTDLVKDGATAIAALGTSVDTQFVDLKGGTTGQVLSKASNTDLDYSWVTTDDANAIQNAIVDAKGDLIAATANDTPARLAVGANGTVLAADSTASTGLSYTANAPLGGMTAINVGGTALTGASTITISGFSNRSRLTVIVQNCSAAASAAFLLTFNGDGGSNYGYTGLFNNGGTLSAAASITATSIPFAKQGNGAGDFIQGILNFEGGFSAGLTQYNLGSAANGSAFEAYNWSGFYLSSAQITSISLTSTSGNFDNGTIFVWGS
jgi:hypothetical protein